MTARLKRFAILIALLLPLGGCVGFTLAKGQVLKTEHLNKLLAQAEGTDFDELLNISTLITRIEEQ